MATSRLLLVAATLALVFFAGGARATWKNECPSGYKGCDSYKPGCETCISSDVNNCGDCGKKCYTVPYATTKCVGGYCKYECNAGWANCDSKWDNGCEVDTGKDANNCGSCGNVCKQYPYAYTKCENGKCGTPVCKSGWANCDGKWDNGCETDTGKDAKNCGSCGNCCKQYPYAETKCENGKCGTPVCKSGWANCDGKWDNGCETDTGKDSNNCGSCGNVCKQYPYAYTKCENGKCGTPVCKSGWANCDGKWDNGCETDTGKDAKNCGSCGNCCKQYPNADTKCENGKCGTPVCKSGWGNCDGNWDNGCETDLTKVVYNCGNCGNKCPCSLKGGEPTCSWGKCGEQCKKGSKYDDKSKCCVPSY